MIIFVSCYTPVFLFLWCFLPAFTSFLLSYLASHLFTFLSLSLYLCFFLYIEDFMCFFLLLILCSIQFFSFVPGNGINNNTIHNWNISWHIFIYPVVFCIIFSYEEHETWGLIFALTFCFHSLQSEFSSYCWYTFCLLCLQHQRPHHKFHVPEVVMLPTCVTEDAFSQKYQSC